MHSSLWLIAPHSDHVFNKCLKSLIDETVPGDFPSSIKKHNFIPHVTLTSDVDPSKTYAENNSPSSSSSPQEWLDQLSLPAEFKKEFNEVTVEMEAVEAGEEVFKKVTLRIGKDANLLKLAAKCREGVGLAKSADEATKWAENDYLPHLSLLYADMPQKKAQERVGMIELQVGFEFGSLFDCCGGQLCQGAKLVLVDTSKEVEDWKPVAERHLPWVRWTMSKSL